MPTKKTGANVPVGQRIKSVRLQKDISLERVANDTGVSIENLKAIESGELIPPVGTLLQIAKALEIDSGFLFRDQEEQLMERVKAYEKRTGNYAYTTLTKEAAHKHLKAFKVVVDARQDHSGVGYCHEGEEFVYVLKGCIQIAVGEHINDLSEGDSLHFNSAIRHMIRNPGDTPAELLVVIYGP
ncbi:MAG: cupin domain-containing protein [Desulfobacterales bacterium]